MKNYKKVLLFHIEKEKKKQIITLCRELDITPVIVPAGQFCEPLGVLAGIEGFARTGRPCNTSMPSKEMMVFSGISPESLDAFFEAYKAAGIAPVPLKAVLTPHNIFWDAKRLYGELEKEYQALS